MACRSLPLEAVIAKALTHAPALLVHECLVWLAQISPLSLRVSFVTHAAELIEESD